MTNREHVTKILTRKFMSDNLQDTRTEDALLFLAQSIDDLEQLQTNRLESFGRENALQRSNRQG